MTITIFFIVLCVSNCVFMCVSQCLKVEQLPITANDPRLMSPWVASIFKRNQYGIWEYKCGATVTSSRSVITAAHCVSITTIRGHGRGGVPYQYHVRYRDLRVVVSLLTNNYYERDGHTQESEVRMVREYKPPETKYTFGYIKSDTRDANLAGVLLKTDFNFTAYVQPACLVENSNTIEETITLRQGEVGMVSGFNVNTFKSRFKNSNDSTKLLEKFEMIIQDSLECVKSYSSNNFNVACAKVSNHGNRRRIVLPCFLEGAGLIVSTNGTNTGVGSLYLMAIYTSNTATRRYTSSVPYPYHEASGSTRCTISDLAFFTKLGAYNQWAVSHVFCDTDLLQCQSDRCRPIEELCDGIAQCEDETDESYAVCANQLDCTVDQFKCSYGACIDNAKVCDGNQNCADNSDESDLKLCRELDASNNVTCPPRSKIKGVKQKCFLPNYLGGSAVSCKSAVPVGTNVGQYCWKYYKEDHGSRSTACQRNGTWPQNESLSCSPDCGISETVKTPFIIGGGNVTTRGEWPWHTAIYRIIEGVPIFICGGTLISTYIVLTAAHCVTDLSTGEVLLPNDHRVILGKLYSGYEAQENGFTQEIPIEKIIVNEYYNPITLESDIALMILNHSVTLTTSVRPVCLSPDPVILHEQLEKANPINGSQFGTTVGFGLDDTQEVSTTLKKLRMPVIPKDICESTLNSQYIEGIRSTWICGGFTNGSSICKGDSGGGFVFPLDSYSGRKYYVQGIVSNGLSGEDVNNDDCNKNSYKIFTQVFPYIHWIQKIINSTRNV